MPKVARVNPQRVLTLQAIRTLIDLTLETLATDRDADRYDDLCQRLERDMSLDTDMMQLIRGHLHVELGNLQGVLQTIAAAGNLSDEQQDLCHEIVTRLGYLRQVVAEPEPDMVSGS
jgi:hypothetical protein